MSRHLLPANMPSGEFHAFLGSLISATNQLNVAISDMQASLLDDVGPSPRHRLQFAMALNAAARTLRGVAIAMQSGTESAQASPSTVGGGVGENDNLSQGMVVVGPGTDSEEERVPSWVPQGNDDGPPMVLSDSSLGQEAVGDDGIAPEVAERVLEEEDRMLSPSDAGAVDSSTNEFTRDPDAASAEARAEMLRVLTQPFGQLSQSLGPGAVPGAVGADAVESLSPQVRECWDRWTRPESFRRVFVQAVQPALSNAYLSGDAAGLHRIPVLPPPAEFLPLRWRRTAARVEGLQQEPEPPEHLSRAYLSAFLRDLGRHVEGNATYRSIPEARERYPHLARLVDFVALPESDRRAGPSA